MNSKRFLLNKIQWARQQEDKKLALLDIIAPTSAVQPILQEKFQKVTQWAFNHTSEFWNVLDDISQKYPAVQQEMLQRLPSSGKDIIMQGIKNSNPCAYVCALGSSDTATLLAYFGIWSKDQYDQYRGAQKQIEQIKKDTATKVAQKFMDEHENIFPIVFHINEFEGFDETCDYLTKKGVYLKPDYQTLHLFYEMRDYLKLVLELNLVYASNRYELDDFLPPVHDWMSHGKNEAVKMALKNTVLIMHKEITEDEYDSLYTTAMTLSIDGLLKSSAVLAQHVAENETPDGIRAYLLCTDFSRVFNDNLTMLNEQQHNEEVGSLIESTRAFLRTYSNNKEWNNEWMKWYDNCTKSLYMACMNKPHPHLIL